VLFRAVFFAFFGMLVSACFASKSAFFAMTSSFFRYHEANLRVRLVMIEFFIVDT
jgi:hypothetical protein